MKRIVAFVLCSVLLLSFAACSFDTAPSLEQSMKDYADFRIALEEEQFVAVNTRVVVMNDGRKALVTDIKNNAPEPKNITQAEFVFAAWDVEGNPIAVTTEDNPNNTRNVIKASVKDVSIAKQETWIADKGLFLSADCKRIAYVTAIVCSCEVDGERWENPMYDSWRNTYGDLPAEHWKLADMVNYLDGDTSLEETAEQITKETQPKMTFVEFCENLLFEDFVAINAAANLQKDGANALMTNIRNASRSPISEITVAFVMWDEEGNPLMIKSASGTSKDAYVKSVDMGDLVIKGATIWNADMGLAIGNARESISHVEAIVVSCKFKETQWVNPLYETWYTYFAGKQLDDTMRSTLADFKKTIR